MTPMIYCWVYLFGFSALVWGWNADDGYPVEYDSSTDSLRLFYTTSRVLKWYADVDISGPPED